MAEIIFNIRRFNPEKDEAPYYQEFKLDIKPGTTVLDALHAIKNTQDNSLAMRFSCRMGVCGSCAMLINGKPGLACNTQVLHVAKTRLCLGPLPNFEIIKDLVPDLKVLFNKHTDLEPFIKRNDTEEMMNPTGEFFQSPEELVNYLQFAYCIKCGACMAACPTLATDKGYMGPMPLTQAHRYNTDTRDSGFNERKQKCGSKDGAFKCHYAGECSNVCPKGVDPARAVQLLKKSLVLDYLRLLKKKPPCGVMDKPEGVERRKEIPFAPEYTVK
jgi:succinate dehydrogenase / fumarate reductase iron-sulfur subunit